MSIRTTLIRRLALLAFAVIWCLLFGEVAQAEFAGRVPNHFAVDVRVNLSAHREFTADCWMIVVRQDDLFLIYPYWISQPFGLGLANNFVRDQVYLQQGEDAWIETRDVRTPIVSDISPSVCGWHGNYNFAGFRDLVAEYYTSRSADSGPKALDDVLARWETTVSGVEGSAVVLARQPGSGSERDDGASVSANRAVITVPGGKALRIFSLPGSTKRESSPAALLIGELTYLSGGRTVNCVQEFDTGMQMLLPKRVTIHSTHRTFDWTALKYYRLANEFSTIESLRDHARSLALTTPIGKARAALQSYLDTYLAGGPGPIHPSVVSELDECRSGLKPYGVEICFAIEEARIGCRVRSNKFADLNLLLVNEQLPMLLQGNNGPAVCDYITFWHAKLADLGLEPEARQFLNDSCLVLRASLAEGDWAMLRARVSTQSKTAPSLAARNSLRILMMYIDGLGSGPPSESSNISPVSTTPGGSELQSVYSFLDYQWSFTNILHRTAGQRVLAKVGSNAAESPPAVSLVDSDEQELVEAKNTAAIAGMSSKELPADLESLHNKLVEIVVARHQPDLEADRLVFVSQALKRGLLSFDKESGIPADNEARLLAAFPPTVAEWRMDSDGVISFGVTMEWLLKVYSEHIRLESRERAEQFAWQQQFLSQAKSRVLNLLQEYNGGNAYVNMRIRNIAAEMDREIANPLDPFFYLSLPPADFEHYRFEAGIQLNAALSKLQRALSSARASSPNASTTIAMQTLNRDDFTAISDCIDEIRNQVITRFCRFSFPPLDSPTWSPYRIKIISYSRGHDRNIIKLEPWK